MYRIALLALVITLLLGVNAMALTLVKDGVSDYAIVTAKEAIPPEQTAAQELQAHLEQAGDGEYHTYDLGVQDLKGGMYFWVAPMNNPEQVEAVYTDRIFLIREK
jgi:hypothetical protein